MCWHMRAFQQAQEVVEFIMLWMKVKACWPYSEPYPWCVAASLPLQQ